MDAWLKERGVLLAGGDLDESPMAYRRLPDVLAQHAGTVRVLHTLRPFAVAMVGSGDFDPFKDRREGWSQGLPATGASIATVARSPGPLPGGHHPVLTLTLRGRPPRLPLSRAAAAFALLRARPPAAPRRAAIQLLEPSRPSSRAGT